MVFRSNTDTKKQAGDASKLYTGKYSDFKPRKLIVFLTDVVTYLLCNR